eukprot:28996-Eustigmatos_ZCMA.PRE.1
MYIKKYWHKYKETIHKSSSKYEDVTEEALRIQCENYLAASNITIHGVEATIQVFYARSKFNETMGRLYGKGGRLKKGGLTLQNIPRAVRHTIARDMYWDLDLENAMPTL